MRLTIGVLLAVLFCPLAQAELIDEINDRGELRIAVLSDTPPYVLKEDQHLTGFDIELGQALAKELDVRAEFVEATAEDVCRVSSAASTTLPSTRLNLNCHWPLNWSPASPSASRTW
jgi:ABC-type amino acid transport substrate-binding protein